MLTASVPCPAGRSLSALPPANRSLLMEWGKKTTLTYKSLLGHLYSKTSRYFLQLVFLCESIKTLLLLQAPRKIREPRYSTQQLPFPACTQHTPMSAGG